MPRNADVRPPLPTADHSSGQLYVHLTGLPTKRCAKCGLTRGAADFLKHWHELPNGYVCMTGGGACLSCEPPPRPFPIRKDADGRLRMCVSNLRDAAGAPLRWRDRYASDAAQDFNRCGVVLLTFVWLNRTQE